MSYHGNASELAARESTPKRGKLHHVALASDPGVKCEKGENEAGIKERTVRKRSRDRTKAQRKEGSCKGDEKRKEKEKKNPRERASAGPR